MGVCQGDRGGKKGKGESAKLNQIEIEVESEDKSGEGETRRTHPSISMILDNWLYSLVPGKSGRPRKSSTAMHPRDHMSMAVE